MYPHRQQPEKKSETWFGWLCRTVLSERVTNRFPLLVLILGLMVRVADTEIYHRFVESEFGFVENATLVFLGLTVFVCALILRRPEADSNVWLRRMVACLLLGAFYFAGEECSWGQHWFGWTTPEMLDDVNRQHETNIQNVNSWFSEKPRLLLELAILAGLVWSYRERRAAWRNGRLFDDWRNWLLPTRETWIVGLIAAVILYPERFAKFAPDATGARLWNFRLAEYQELYFGLFLAIYVCSLYQRLTAEDESGVADVLPLPRLSRDAAERRAA